ncbi:MAG TPA: class I SAM-dependent methyltransferase [Anaeromyxobacteraceae bacterium]|nr:class I SAM-dependent methyltransferase [Anaeromyxobacteraceae bacterium]
MDATRRETCRPFLEPSLRDDTLNVYVPRVAILRAVRASLGRFRGTLLDVGCGQMPYRELILAENPAVTRYLGLDLASSDVHDTRVADLHWDGRRIPLENGSVQSAMATEVLEHAFDPLTLLSEIHRVLEPGGAFFFTVPFLWPLHETPHDAYRYTPYSLRMHLERSGFVQVGLRSLGGWHASMAQMIGLWAVDAGLAGLRRRVARRVARIAIPWLLRIDEPDDRFGQHCMVTGLHGTAVRGPEDR